MHCENCEKEHDGSYGSGRFCSIKCARGYSTKAKRKEINEKVSKKMKGRPSPFRHPEWKPCKEIICTYCNKTFTQNHGYQKFCSLLCARKHNWLNAAARKGGLASAKKQAESRRSKNEKLFCELCENHFKNVKHNEQIFNGWDADVIIEDLKIAVLWNGKWHYEKITEKHSVKQVQNRDKIKIKEIKLCGYTPYVIKDMGGYNPEFVKEQFEKFLDNC